MKYLFSAFMTIAMFLLSSPGYSAEPSGETPAARTAPDPLHSLTFPVEGAGTGDIVSYFGDGRDNGSRLHHGVDIKAPRHTPALAVCEGVVRKVGQTVRGGNVVSIWDSERKISYYYSHLETQTVTRGQNVRAGDIIGTVGNSGNASGTFPHLHFGIYGSDWEAVDPLPYLLQPVAAAALENSGN